MNDSKFNPTAAKSTALDEVEEPIVPTGDWDGDHGDCAVDETSLSAFLVQLEPQLPPLGLVESIEALIPPNLGGRKVRPQQSLAWEGARWALRGPMSGIRILSVPTFGIEQGWQGISTLRFAMGPLLRARPSSRLETKRNWWMRQAGRLWR